MICVPISASDTPGAAAMMTRAAAWADLLELRLDLMAGYDLPTLVRQAPRPVIATYRSVKQGGRGRADNTTRIRLLTTAVEAGASYLDVEYGLPLEVREELLELAGPDRTILSHHHLNDTPPASELAERLRRMASSGAGTIKIVTRARAVEDNLTLLGLLPQARELGVEIIAFCMGPLGRLSRIGCVPLGGLLTFAALEEGAESAAGQLPARQMRAILELLTA